MLRGICAKFYIEIIIVIDMQGLLLLVWRLRIFPEREEDQKVSDLEHALIVRFLWLLFELLLVLGISELPQHHIPLITLQTPPFYIG